HGYPLTCRTPSKLFVNVEFDAIRYFNFEYVLDMWPLDVDYQSYTLMNPLIWMLINDNAHLNAL
ncbi:hypothetical protein, partial [Klebsiella pneumoniae]|uniref:hypothetical protein n=1 Tax=Klebsiella pneumoniae TaxID=573 RepID=UPI001C6F9701